MPIEQVRKNPRLHLARRQRRIPVRVALVSRAEIGRRNRRAIRINRGSKNHGVPIRQPERVVGLGRNPGQLLRIAGRAGSSIKVRRPNLLPALAPAEKQNPLPIRRELRAAVPSLSHRNLERGSAGTRGRRNRLQPQLRCLAIRRQVHRRHRVGQPLPIRRNGRLAQPLHLHHVLKSHGPLGITPATRTSRRGPRLGLSRAEGRRRKRDKNESENIFAHRFFLFAESLQPLPREEEVYTGNAGHLFLPRLPIVSSRWRTIKLEGNVQPNSEPARARTGKSTSLPPSLLAQYRQEVNWSIPRKAHPSLHNFWFDRKICI